MITKIINTKEVIPLEVEDNTLLDIGTTKVTQYTHGFHKYPGKFIPQIPRWGIEKYMKSKSGQVLLDPFCGSGTTLVEGLIFGVDVIGVDVDPLSRLISKVKTTLLDMMLLEQVDKWFWKEFEGIKPMFIPECETIEHWFTEDAICKLSKIRTLIDGINSEFGESDKVNDIKDFMIVCFSSIIRRASNADNQSQKTYVSGTKPKVPEEVVDLFKKQFSMYRDRMDEL